ncbi:MAG: DNA topoisomerase IB [Gemmatimonadales bacterium]
MAQQWILRKGTKASGFRYVTPAGKPVKQRDHLERIDELRIPPAWTGVHIAASPKPAIQAWGFDVRGRKQYRYHVRAVEKGSLRKHYRVRQLGTDLPRLRRRLDTDFHRKGFPKEKICAGIVLLISSSFFRVGSERYERDNNTFGITTLRKRHVFVDGDVVIFEYAGKRGIKQRQFIESPEMAKFVKSLLGTPGPRLFRYQEEGKWVNVDARDVNEYLKGLADFPYTAKDFRTWGGTLRMATILADIGSAQNERARNKNVVSAIRFVAAELGNTPAIARKSYVHPVIISRYLKNGSTIEIESARRTLRRQTRFGHAPEEIALINFLDEHFPDRRKTRRVPQEKP